VEIRGNPNFGGEHRMEEEVKDEEVKEEGTNEEAEKTEAVTEEIPEEKKAEEKIEENVDENVDEKPLDKMTAPELREVAKQIPGVTGTSAMKKAELLAVIKEFRGIKDEEPAKEKKTKAPESVQSPKELKLQITRLREEKEKAREAKDKKKIDILRRRINRMKKQTRKAAQA
jgi:hypothetical protein